MKEKDLTGIGGKKRAQRVNFQLRFGQLKCFRDAPVQ